MEIEHKELMKLRKMHFASQRELYKAVNSRLPGWRDLLEIDKIEKRKALTKCLLRHYDQLRSFQFDNVVSDEEVNRLCEQFGIEV